MADKQINQLVAASTINNDDLFVLQQGGTAKKLTGAKLGDYVYNAAAEKIEEVNEAVAEAQAAVDQLIEDKNEIAEAVASMAQLGTDTSLTTPGMAADAGATGEVRDDLEELEETIWGTYDKKTASGSIVSFNDGASNVPLDELVVDIDPVQDLHGYGNPWPAGGGKNLLPYPYYSNNGTYGGVSLTTDSKGKITFSGTTSSEFTFYIANGFGLKAGTYTFSIKGNHSGLPVYVRNADASMELTHIESANSDSYATFTLESDVSDVRIYFYAASGGDTVNFSAYFQLESGSSATSFVPYSNICPISGHTECEVTRTGKNLFDKTSATGNYMSSDGSIVVSANNSHSDYIPIKNNTNYYFSHVVGSSSFISAVVFDKNKEAIGFKSIGGSSDVSSTLSFENGAYIVINFANANIDIVQVELGSVASSYEDYQPIATYDIDFPQAAGTVYGGALTVHQDGTGELVVDKVAVDMGTINYETNASLNASGTWPFHITNKKLSENMPICESFPVVAVTPTWSVQNYEIMVKGNDTSCRIKIPNCTTKAQIEAATSGVYLVYEIATPTTYTLTAEQVRTLLGTNNIWADTGDISLTYSVDPQGQYDDMVAKVDSVQGMIAEVESGTTASRNYAVGERFVFNNQFCKATTAIASGEAFDTSVSGNCEVITVDDVIDALDAGDIGYSESDTYAAGSVGAEVSGLKSALQSGSEEDAIYHLGFYLDENGDLCQVDDE